MLTNKQIDKLESLPKRLSVGYEKRHTGWWDDNFKKSANEHYSSGYNYAFKCSKSFVGKPVKELIHTLRHKCKKAHRSFKIAVEGFIKDYLLHRIEYHNSTCKVSTPYVDEIGNVQIWTKEAISAVSIEERFYDPAHFKAQYPQYLHLATNLYWIREVKKQPDILEVEGSTFKHILRHKGLLYYVTNTDLDDYDVKYVQCPRLIATHFKVRERAWEMLKPLKIKSKELEYLDLVDVKESFHV